MPWVYFREPRSQSLRSTSNSPKQSRSIVHCRRCFTSLYGFLASSTPGCLSLRGVYKTNYDFVCHSYLQPYGVSFRGAVRFPEYLTHLSLLIGIPPVKDIFSCSEEST
ncbi:hypothetical protein BDV30DRAFT_97123 [Aspergillus minisclerotigenes]|uniref:Uncharacterized protein n=1 Tax=Aspergillus minisclerotigenes TaxID=656917 RepID=A0A5N6J6U7_9EURO|nr:hypothetical protein BDV30DRAFT_97123 [Aspergillus minisclerotigenes]